LSDEPQDIFDQLLSENALSKAPKNPKSSARQKYNRRKNWLARALDEMEIAIDDMLSQDGTVYKRDEIDTLKNAIGKFRNDTGLTSPEPPTPTQEELDHLMNVLTNAQPWEPPSEATLAEIYALLKSAPETGDEATEDDRSRDA